MRATMRPTSSDSTESAIADLRRFPLKQVLDNKNPMLSSVGQRVIDNLGQPDENFAAHGTTPTP